MYATRALFHLIKEAKDPLHEQILDKYYKFPSMESLSLVSSWTQMLCKKYFNQYLNLGGRENTFMKAKKKMEKVKLKFLFCVCLLLFLFLFYILIFGFIFAAA